MDQIIFLQRVIECPAICYTYHFMKKTQKKPKTRSLFGYLPEHQRGAVACVFPLPPATVGISATSGDWRLLAILTVFQTLVALALLFRAKPDP